MKRLLPLLLCAACSSSPAIESFTAAPTSVARGEPVTFRWRVRNADRLELRPLDAPVSGNEITVRPPAEADYMLFAWKGDVSVFATVHIAVIDLLRFYASPAEVAPGAAVTLSWKLSGASTARLAGQDVDPGQGSLQVFPTQDTTYQLVARREEGTLTANALVRVGLPPVITAFTASPDPVPRGSATALSWQAPGAQTFSLGGGVGPGYAGPLHGTRVRPLTSTRYTLTATNAFGSATRDLDVAVSGPLGSKLVYTDPPSGSEALRLVKSSASTDLGVVLQLVSTGAAPALDGIALNLPLDGAAPGSRDGIARVALSPQSVSFGGLDVTSGSATPAAALALPGRGLLAGVLTLGMAQKPSAAGGPAGDAPLPAGTVLATFQLDLQPAGGTGLALDGTSGTGFRLRLRSRSGDVPGTVAVGKLEVQ